jgi:transcriptional regulator with XRE-family HTH domain
MTKHQEFEAFIAVVNDLITLKGLNDTALSTKAGLSPDYMHRIRKRKSIPKLSTMKQLAEALDEPVETFSAAAHASDAADAISQLSGQVSEVLNLPLLTRLLSRLLEELGHDDFVAEALSQSLGQAYRAAVTHRLSQDDTDRLELLIATEAQKMRDEQR